MTASEEILMPSPSTINPKLDQNHVELHSCPLEYEHAVMNLTLLERVQRSSLTRFPVQSVRSSNADALDSPYLLVLITRTSQSRQHESRKSTTAVLFDDDSGRISIHHYEILKSITLNVLA
ncbi:hypothetical protein Tco_1202756 [Tanacetum coccineum]